MSQADLKEDVRTRVSRLVTLHLDIYDRPGLLDEELDLIDDLGADSLDLIELGQVLEVEFDVAISDDQMDQMRTIGAIYAFLEGNPLPEPTDVPVEKTGHDFAEYDRLMKLRNSLFDYDFMKKFVSKAKALDIKLG